MISPIQVTGPHASKSFKEGAVYQGGCEVCGMFSYLELENRDAVRGDLVKTILAHFEHERLEPALSEEEVNLQTVASQTANYWYRELRSYGCKHCPPPFAITAQVG